MRQGEDRISDGLLALPLDSWYGGDVPGYFAVERVELPPGWDVLVHESENLGDVPPMGPDDLRRALENPFDTDALPDLARGKRRAVVMVDDLSRPTPAYEVMPLILDQLNEGGIGDDRIEVVIATGSHRPLNKYGDLEHRRKLGDGTLRRVPVFDHDCYDEDTVEIPRTGRAPIRVNRHVGEADLRIGVGSIVPHGGAGFGGGAKILVPGVVHIETIRENHELAWEGRGILYEEVISSACIRRDAEEIARFVGLDFVVNTVNTPERGIAGLFAGDFVKAHRAGSRFAYDLYLTDPPSPDAHIIVAGSYPLDTDLGQSGRGGWPFSNDKICITVAGCDDDIAYHGEMPYAEYLKSKQNRESATYTFKGTSPEAGARSYMYSPKLSPEEYYQRERPTKLFSTWADMIEEIEKTHSYAKVAVFPYASLQIPRI